jgi:uncharacterized Zn finger protein
VRYYDYDDRFPVTLSAADRRAKAAKKLAALRKAGHSVSPVVIPGSKIATTFWGTSWCKNLESYHDYASRLPRGRSYVSSGSVIDLQFTGSGIKALVVGTDVYTISVTIKPLPAPQWKSICADCAGGIDSLVELLQGRFAKGVMERLCRQDGGLFPKPKEIKFDCDCPDSASMCKHIAATLYGVGARLDQHPELLFKLRGVSESDLIRHVEVETPLTSASVDAGKLLQGDDMSALFGIEMAVSEAPVEKPPARKPRKQPAASPRRTKAAV